MPDPIRIPLDGPVPTEPGLYLYADHRGVVQVADIVWRDGELRMMFNHQFGMTSSLENAHLARWSRRIEIGG